MKMIVACDSMGGIAKNRQIPWKISSDIKMFKLMTIGDTVIMGRKTFETIGKPLVDRFNIIISRDADESASQKYKEGEIVKITPDELISLNDNSSWIIGGEIVYNFAFENKLVDQIFVSRISGDYDCDQFIKIPDEFYLASTVNFPEFILEKWLNEIPNRK